MKLLRHKQDFLDLAAAHPCSAACGRAVREGSISPIRRVTLPWGNQGWTFAVQSFRGNEWSFTIELREAERRYRVHSHKVN